MRCSHITECGERNRLCYPARLATTGGREYGTQRRGHSRTIEFKGLFTVTDRNGDRFQECTENTWRFTDDNGWVITVGIGENPRVAIAGNDRTPLSIVGEAIASTIRAMKESTAGGATGG
jgi:hypothetical protein